MIEFMAGPPAEPPAMTVKLAPELLNRLSFPRKCESHKSGAAQRAKDLQAQVEQDLKQEQLLEVAEVLKKVLASPAEPSGPEIDLSDFPSDDWEPNKEPETFERIFNAIETLLAPGLTITVVLPANCVSFAAWQVLKVALLIRVACAPLRQPEFRLPPGMAALECRLLNLTNPVDADFNVEDSPEWAEAAREYVRNSTALQATRSALKRARFYLYGRKHEEARLIAQQTLEGDFKRFLYEELYPRIDEHKRS